MRYVEQPNLPRGDVRLAAVSGTYSEILHSLASRGIETVEIRPNKNLDQPIQSHADMLCHHLGGNQLMIAQGERDLRSRFEKFGFRIFESERPVRSPYPNDSSLNVLRVGNLAFMGKMEQDKKIRTYFQNQNIRVIEVRQGYARCSVAVVDDQSVITADVGIAQACIQTGLYVLHIRPGFIRLEGYPYGFIGGCCGKLGKNKIGFAGDLTSHPDCNAILEFLSIKRIEVIPLMDGPLTDIGGILPLMEEADNGR